MTSPKISTSIPPGPRRLPIVGHSLRYRRDRLRFLEDMHACYGPSVTVYFGSVPVFLFSRLETVRAIFGGRLPLVSRDAVRNVRFLLGDTLRPSDLFSSIIKACCGCMHERAMLASDGPEHWEQRRGANPNPTRPEMDAFVSSMKKVTQNAMKQWLDGQPFDVHEAMREISLRIVASTLFDVEDRIDILMPAFKTILNHNTRLGPLALTGNREYREAWTAIEAAIDQIIASHGKGGKQPPVGLHALFTEDVNSGAFPRDRVKHYIFQMLGMGHATTASALTFALLLLARHSEVAAEASREVAAAVGAEGITRQSLAELKLVEMIALETLRMFPVIWGQARVATEDLLLEGYRIQRGSFLIVSPWIIHRSPDNFARPLEFDPWRFAAHLDGDLPPAAFRPFGSGPHRCIGDRFALLEMKTVLATVMREVKLVDSDQQPIRARARTLILEPESRHHLLARRWTNHAWVGVQAVSASDGAAPL